MFKVTGYTLGLIAGLASVALAIWKMWIIGAFIAFFIITFGKK